MNTECDVLIFPNPMPYISLLTIIYFSEVTQVYWYIALQPKDEEADKTRNLTVHVSCLSNEQNYLHHLDDLLKNIHPIIQYRILPHSEQL